VWHVTASPETVINLCSDAASLVDVGVCVVVVACSGSRRRALSRHSAANSIVAIGIAVDSDVLLHASSHSSNEDTRQTEHQHTTSYNTRSIENDRFG